MTCDYKCKTCLSSASNCQTCGDNRSIKPLCDCLATFYDDGSSEACKSCHYSCKTCINSASCTSCDSTTAFRSLVASSNFCLCRGRYFESSTPNTLVCSSCHPTCFECSGSSVNTVCSACSSSANRQLGGTTCVCKSGFYETDPLIEVCTACNYRCKTCFTSATTCTSCSSWLYRIQSGATCPCMSGYFESIPTGLCTLCHSSCESCINAIECTTCDTINKLYSLDSNKLCSCEDTTYFNGTTNKCIAC